MSNEDWLTNQADDKIRARQATQKDERRRMKFVGFSDHKYNKKVCHTC